MYCCCSLYVLYKLPQLKFLDSSAFSDTDRLEAQQRGPYLGVVRVADDAFVVICAHDLISYASLLSLIFSQTLEECK